MTLNNLLQDSIIRIKNGYESHKANVILNKSNLSIKILEILRKEGYIKAFIIKENLIIVTLKYYKDKGAIKNITSYLPSNKKAIFSFKEVKELFKNRKTKINGLGLTILSTPLGILTDYDCIKKRQGGKPLITIL